MNPLCCGPGAPFNTSNDNTEHEKNWTLSIAVALMLVTIDEMYGARLNTESVATVSC